MRSAKYITAFLLSAYFSTATAADISGTVSYGPSDQGWRPGYLKVRVQGTSLVTTVEGTDGTYTLTNVPNGTLSLVLEEDVTNGCRGDAFTTASKHRTVVVADENVTGADFNPQYRWRQFSLPTPATGTISSYAPQFLSDEVGFVCVHVGGVDPQRTDLYRTLNSGTSWTLLKSWDRVGNVYATTKFVFTDQDHGVILWNTNQAILGSAGSTFLYTSDGGTTWNTANSVQMTPTGWGIGVSRYARISVNHIIAAGSVGGAVQGYSGADMYEVIWETTDGGANWTKVFHLQTDSGACTALDASAGGRAIAFFTPYSLPEDRIMYRATNGTWSSVSPAPFRVNTGYGLGDVSLVGDEIAFASSSTSMWKGVWNTGTSEWDWNIVGGGMQYYKFVDAKRGFCIAAGAVYSTYDGGQTYFYQSPGNGLIDHGNEMFAFDATHAIWRDNDNTRLYRYFESAASRFDLVARPCAIDPACTTAGSSNVSMLPLSVNNTGNSDISISALTLHATGSGHDATDIVAVRIYQSTSARSVVDQSMTLLGSGNYAADNGAATVTFGSALTLTPGAQSYLLVAYDFAAAPFDKTYSCSLSAADVQANAVPSQPSGSTLASRTVRITLPIFSDSFETGLGNWDFDGSIAPVWGTTTGEYALGTNSATVDTSAGRTLTLKNALDFSNATLPKLLFKIRSSGCEVEASLNNGSTWQSILNYSGGAQASQFVEQRVDLSSYAGRPAVLIRFSTRDNTALDALQVVRANAIRIYSATTATGVRNSPFSYQIQATDGPTAYQVSGVSWLSVNGSGSITGTPTSAGTFNATVMASNALGSDSISLAITIALEPPTVSSVSPNTGGIRGGTDVVITGTHFEANPTVRFGGLSASYVTLVSPTQITCRTPNYNADETVAVSVTNNDGQSDTLAAAFHYSATAPYVNGIGPTSGSTAGGTQVSLSGESLGVGGGASVTFGGVPATNVTVVSADTISCTTGAHAAGLVDVLVTNADGQSCVARQFYTYQSPPTISAVSPATGPTAGGTSVTLTGTYFEAGAAVYFGFAQATNVQWVNSTTLTCTTPSFPGDSTVDVKVENAGGLSGVKSSAYQFTGASTSVVVYNVLPETGPTAGGTSVTLLGSGFASGAVVSFDGQAATNVVVVDSGSLTCITPAHAAGGVAVAVTNPDASNSSLWNGFTYSDAALVAPAITSVLTASATRGVAFSYTISASGSAPMLFSAAGLPTDLNLSVDTISGTPTVSGSAAITLTASNAAGTASRTLILTISDPGTIGANVAPAFTSLPSASPNPARVAESVTFSAAATDPDGQLLSYTWDFGDGASGSGATASHIYAAAGVYLGEVTVSDGSASDTRSVTVAVNASGGTDGDPAQFTILKTALKFNFRKENADMLIIMGTLPVQKDTSPSGKKLIVSIGEYLTEFTLDDKGAGAVDGTDVIKTSGRLVDGKYVGDSVKFVYSVKKKSLFEALESLGFSNETVGRPGEEIEMPVLFSLDADSYLEWVTVTYTAQKNKMGGAK